MLIRDRLLDFAPLRAFCFVTIWNLISPHVAFFPLFFCRGWCEGSRAAQIVPQPPGGRQWLPQRLGLLHPIRVFRWQKGRRRSDFLMRWRKCHVVNSVKQEPGPRLGRPSSSLWWRSTCKSFLLVICWKGDVCAQLYLFDLDSLSVFPYAAFIYLRLCDFDLSSTFQSSLFSFPSSSWFPLGFGGGVFLNNPNLAKDENCTEEHVLFFWIYVRLCNWVWMVDRACVWTILKSNIHSFFCK